MSKVWLTKREDENVALNKGKEKVTGHKKLRVKRYSAVGETVKEREYYWIISININSLRHLFLNLEQGHLPSLQGLL